MSGLRATNGGVIVFDGDDTLWGTQELYDEAKARFFALVHELGHDHAMAESKFADIDVANVARFGLSRERFPTSMRETYEFLCLTAGAPTRPDIVRQAASIAQGVFDATPAVRADAASVLTKLSSLYRLVLFTAGDDQVQRTRVERSGLAQYFTSIHITPSKTRDSWERLLVTERSDPRCAWSIGNSVRSDINPALKLGLRCVIVAGRTWQYERTALAQLDDDAARVWRANTLSEAAAFVIANDRHSSAASGSAREQTA